MKDVVVPFVFESLPVRGALVQLENAWQRMQEGHDYANPVSEILGHAAAATTLIAQSLKFDGSITMQISSQGPLGMVVMQATDDLDIRGMATSRDIEDDAQFAELVESAHCAVTVDAGAMERPYQGIVEINPESIAASFENYFDRSVQVPSHMVLQSAQSHCGGILLQQMPGEQPATEDDWRRLGFLIATLRSQDLTEGATAELLHKLFAEDDVRMFQSRKVRFHCRCTQSRVEEVLRFLGEEETRAALEEKGSVDVTCEYCGKVRSFDPVDVSRVFSDYVVRTSDVLH
ncbi:MAG: Hsp33 family molecular chaperone HslO [Gammaproteobacteria bacterium]|nr:Hsp33 family molecular chaperone HslO [Gammaproteobacteria bacterium]